MEPLKLKEKMSAWGKHGGAPSIAKRASFAEGKIPAPSPARTHNAAGIAAGFLMSTMKTSTTAPGDKLRGGDRLGGRRKYGSGVAYEPPSPSIKAMEVAHEGKARLAERRSLGAPTRAESVYASVHGGGARSKVCTSLSCHASDFPSPTRPFPAAYVPQGRDDQKIRTSGPIGDIRTNVWSPIGKQPQYATKEVPPTAKKYQPDTTHVKMLRRKLPQLTRSMTMKQELDMFNELVKTLEVQQVDKPIRKANHWSEAGIMRQVPPRRRTLPPRRRRRRYKG